MKKGLLLTICSLFSIGCSGGTSTKFSLDEKYYNSSTVFIDYTSFTQLQAVVDAKGSFGLYLHVASCTLCAKFNPIIQEALTNYQISFLRAEVSLTNPSTNIFSQKTTSGPAVFLVKEGEVSAWLNPTDSKDGKYYESVDSFSSWLGKYINVEVG